MICCSKCGEKREYLLWRVDCLQCEEKVCPKCNKKKLGVFKLSESAENCTCNLAPDNKEKECSLCGEVLSEPSLKIFCPDCLMVNYGVKTKLPEPIKNPSGKGRSLFGRSSMLVLIAVLGGFLLIVGLIWAIIKLKKN